MTRRRTIFVLALATLVAYPAFGDSCGGIKTSLAIVFRDLTRDQLDEAERALAPIEASYPDCPQTLIARARVEAAKGEAVRAEDLFVRYTNLEPDDASGYAYYAAFLIGQREYQRADSMSAVAMEKNSNDPAALAVRGHILDMKGESQEGVTLLQRACDLDPENGEAHFQLGVIYKRDKRPGDAVKHFEKATVINSADPRGWDYFALSLEALGEVEKTEKAYAKALDVNKPGPHFDAFLDYNYGRFLVKQNQLAEAKKHLDRAVELVPQVRAAWYERAKLNMRMRNYQEARSDGERAAAIADRAGIIIDLQIYVLLEQVYRRLGETELAQKYAQLARETHVPIRGDHR